MKYLGSKSRIAKHIIPILQGIIDKNNITHFDDVFCGGLNVSDKIKCDNINAYDLSSTLVALFEHLQNDGELLEEVPREVYNDARTHQYDGTYEDWYLGNIGFLSSYNGRGFSGGYAQAGYEKTKKGQRYRDYYQEAKANILKQVPFIKNIKLHCCDYREVVAQGHLIYCFDKDTEVLTNNGWKFFKDVEIENDLFLSREPNTKKLEWVNADYYINYRYTGKMYSYKGRHLDICVTDNHNIFGSCIETRKRTRREFLMKAEEFANLPNERTFIKAGGEWEGEHFKTIKIADQEFDSVLFARLLGIFITDGSVNNQGCITINQSKSNIVSLITDLLDKLDFEYSHYEYGDSHTFYLHKKYLPYFQQFYLKENRRIPKEFKNASKEIIEQLVEGIIDGDSDYERRRINVPTMGLVDDIQECLYKIGLASNYTVRQPKASYYEKENRYITSTKPYYVVSVLRTEYPQQVKSNVEWIDYDDEVYCVTLSKWHTVLTRRNGCTVWMGQCDPPYKDTKQYENSKNFDHEMFWETMRDWSKDNIVVISEMQAPEDFICIWRQEVSRSIKATDKSTAVEKLFIHKSNLDKI